MSVQSTLSPEQDIEDRTRRLFRELARPIEADRVKWRWGDQKKSFKLHYITARTTMNRLDEVVGPENWWDDYTPGENSVLCRLSIRLPDGRVLTKQDAGGYPGMSDEGDDEKGGFSDAFKRAGVKFGIARELYGDGVARPRLAPGTDRDRAPEPETEPEPLGTGVPAVGPDRGPAVDPANPWFYDFLMNEVETCNKLWQDEHGNSEEIVEWGDAVLHMARVTYGPRFHPYDPDEFTGEPAEWIGTLIKVSNDRKEITVEGEVMSKGEWMSQHLQSWLSDQWQGAIRRRAGIPPGKRGPG